MEVETRTPDAAREPTVLEQVLDAHNRLNEHRPAHEHLQDRLSLLERHMGRVFPEFRKELEEMLDRPKKIEHEGPSQPGWPTSR